MIPFMDKAFFKGDKVIIKTFENEKYIGEIAGIYEWPDVQHGLVQTVAIETLDGDVKEIDNYRISSIEYL